MIAPECFIVKGGDIASHALRLRIVRCCEGRQDNVAMQLSKRNSMAFLSVAAKSPSSRGPRTMIRAQGQTRLDFAIDACIEHETLFHRNRFGCTTDVHRHVEGMTSQIHQHSPPPELASS